jgi:DNA mismatch endonuclease (patch repair protein)
LPCKPDIVLRKYNSIIFVHGCFWHLHSKCRDGTIPKSRIKYWKEKLLKNKERDAKNIRELKQLGWEVLRLWECEIEKNPERVINKIKKLLKDS